LLLASGCGIDDYEKRMAASEKRLERITRIAGDEGKYLRQTPLEMPQKVQKVDKVPKEHDALPFNFFLLPPRNVETRPQRSAGHLYSYGGSPLKIYVGATRDTEGAQAFRRQVGKDLLGVTDLDQRTASETREPVSGPPLKLHSWETDNKSYHYFIYFLDDGKNHFAVAYEVDKEQAEKGDVKRAIETSVLSLAIGGRAARLRSACRQANSRQEFLRLRMQIP
jgi:hypothetical protein